MSGAKDRLAQPIASGRERTLGRLPADWNKFLCLFGHPTQVMIIEAYERIGYRISPVQLTKVLREGLTDLDPDRRVGHIGYHVRKLRDAGIIKEVGRKPVRGAVEHFYELVPPRLLSFDLEEAQLTALRELLSNADPAWAEDVTNSAVVESLAEVFDV